MPLASARSMLTVAALTIAFLGACTAPSLAVGPSPNLVKGAAYLTSPANLIGGHYFESFPRTADFGLTMDGAFALAATGKDLKALQKIISFLDQDGKDQSGRTVDDWTGIGTKSANGGSIAKEAVLAEVVGDSPRDFGGHNLIAALDASVCLNSSPGTGGPCAGPGNYRYATSVFSQALGVIAQVRAGQPVSANSPVTFLESLRNPDGSFPSLIPDTHDKDIDSTAIAVMTLALIKAPQAKADVTSGLAWIAAQQQPSGGFRGAGGLSVNSAGLAIQALSLRPARYRAKIGSALAFLAREQNANGGFDAYAGGQSGSNVRASTQALSGATGISFGTLTRHLNSAAASLETSPPAAWLPVTAAVIALAIIVAAVGLLRRRRLAPRNPPSQPRDRISS